MDYSDNIPGTKSTRLRDAEGDCSAEPCPVAGPDKEALLKRFIYRAVEISIAATEKAKCGADMTIVNGAIEGAVNGAAIEIIHYFGMKPSYINLRHVD